MFLNTMMVEVFRELFKLIFGHKQMLGNTETSIKYHVLSANDLVVPFSAFFCSCNYIDPYVTCNL